MGGPLGPALYATLILSVCMSATAVHCAQTTTCVIGLQPGAQCLKWSVRGRGAKFVRWAVERPEAAREVGSGEGEGGVPLPSRGGF